MLGRDDEDLQVGMRTLGTKAIGKDEDAWEG